MSAAIETEDRAQLRYRPELDGLRAIAALAVLAFHSTTHARGGWLGVQVFFVLSGYLIFSLLHVEYAQSGHVKWSAFMRRRLARLYPALVVTVLVGGVVMALYPARTPGHAATAIVSALGYFGNWVNFARPQSTGPLVHTWTLAIEWQFYLLAPLVGIRLLAKTKRARSAWLLGAAATFFAARLATGLVGGFDRSFFATWSQIDCLALGCFLATAARPKRIARLAGAFAIGTLAVFAIWCLVGPAQTSATGQGAGALAAASLATAVLVADPTTRIAQLLSWKPLVEIGKRSYGIYLYHFPIAWALQANDLPSSVTVPAIPLISILAAWVSFGCIEKPARRWMSPRRPVGVESVAVVPSITG